MKKAFFLLAFSVAGLMSAASTTEFVNEETKTNKNVEIKADTGRTEYQGFAAYDTSCCGTCFVYGTYTEWDFGNGVVFWEFQSASQATQATVITPPCTGAGSYLA